MAASKQTNILWRYGRLAILLFCLCLTAGNAAAAGGKTLVVAGDVYFPPYEFIEERNGSPVYRGFNIDVLQAAALQQGYEIEFRPMPWDEALTALESGQVDAIGGMKYDSERLARFDFSEEFMMINAHAIFVRQETGIISGIPDLAGRRVAVQKDDVAQQHLEGQAIELIKTRHQEEALQQLLQGKVDAVVGNKLAGQYILQRLQAVGQVKIVGSLIEPQRYCIAVRKGNQAVLTVLNRGLHDIKQNGTYDTLYRKWFGQTIEYPLQQYKQYLLIAESALIVIVLLTVLMVALNLMLKREVGKRTRELEQMNEELLRKNHYIKEVNQYQNKLLNSGYTGIVTVADDGAIHFMNALAVRYLYQGEAPPDAHLRDALGDAYPQDGLRIGANGDWTLHGRYLEYAVDAWHGDQTTEAYILFVRDVTAERQWRQEAIRKDRMEALGQLVACIAHEIRNPLTAIKTFVELLPHKYDKPAFREKMQQLVPREIQRLDAIISDLLNYAKPRAGGRAWVDVAALIDSTLQFFADVIQQQQVTCQIDGLTGLQVYADAQQLRQIIINIVLNALQAMQEGAGKRLLLSGGRTAAGEVWLRIADDGPGIAPEVQARMFDPFFTTKASGTGLGLFVCYQLAQQNDANIEAVSQQGQGTAFTLTFSAKVGDASHV